MTPVRLEPAGLGLKSNTTTEPLRCKSDMEFGYQIIVSAIKFRKRFAKFMIPIVLFKKFLS